MQWGSSLSNRVPGPRKQSLSSSAWHSMPFNTYRPLHSNAPRSPARDLGWEGTGGREQVPHLKWAATISPADNRTILLTFSVCPSLSPLGSSSPGSLSLPAPHTPSRVRTPLPVSSSCASLILAPSSQAALLQSSCACSFSMSSPHKASPSSKSFKGSPPSVICPTDMEYLWLFDSACNLLPHVSPWLILQSLTYSPLMALSRGTG